MVQRFRFTGIDPNQPSPRIRIGLCQANGPAVLNKIISPGPPGIPGPRDPNP